MIGCRRTSGSQEATKHNYKNIPSVAKGIGFEGCYSSVKRFVRKKKYFINEAVTDYLVYNKINHTNIGHMNQSSIGVPTNAPI